MADYVNDGSPYTHPAPGQLACYGCGGGASYAGLGAAMPPSPHEVMLMANAAVTPLPPAVVAAINTLPISGKRKKGLKTYPLSFMVVIAWTARDKLIEFIKKTQARSGRKSSVYSFGNVLVDVRPNNKDVPAMLAARFLTVSNKNPIAAAQVAAEMAIELAHAPLVASEAAMLNVIRSMPGGDAAIAAVQGTVGAGVSIAQQQADIVVKAAEKQVAAAAKQTGAVGAAAKKKADKALKDAKKKAEKLAKSLNPFGAYGGFGEGATAAVAGATAAEAAPAPLVAGEYAGGLTGPQIVSIVGAAITLAGVVVPALIKLADNKIPNPQSEQQKAAAGQEATAAVDQYTAALPPGNGPGTLAGSADLILGLPRDVAIGGGVLALLGTGAAVLVTLKKKKRR